jgi:transcription elongation GreA/GreB family factor
MAKLEIDKGQVLDALRHRVDADLESITRSQRATHAGATHEESRPENAKDTRALESTYLARGLAERVSELQNARAALSSLVLESFEGDRPIGVGALVTLELEDADGNCRMARYLVTPVAGGLRLTLGGVEIDSLSPQSPLGRALLGQSIDDEVEFRTPQGTRSGVVLSIS